MIAPLSFTSSRSLCFFCLFVFIRIVVLVSVQSTLLVHNVRYLNITNSLDRVI